MNTKLAIPDAASLVLSLRSVGYTLETALADIIDNSITAEASEIHIDIEWNAKTAFISICDNGYGMTEEELHQAMKIGSKNPKEKRLNTDLGRFGMGLKTAAFSICRRLTVVSKPADKANAAVRVWDLDNIESRNLWELFTETDTLAWNYVQSRFNNIEQGTIVLLENLDGLVTEEITSSAIGRFWKRIADVEKHLAMVFHRFISGSQAIRIYINDNPIIPWDPYLASLYATQEFNETLCHKNHIVNIHAYILPHHSKLSNKDYESVAGITGWLDQQGFYVYRNKRLIVPGTWFRLVRKNEPSQLARIQIDLDGEMDFDWKIDIKKSSAAPPAALREEIQRIARNAQEASRKVYFYRGKVINQNILVDDNDAIWEQATARGRTYFRINKSHFLIREVISQLSNDNQQKLSTFLSLVEGFAPMNVINTGLISEESKISNELIEGALALYEGLTKAGYASNEAFHKVLNISIYEGLAEKIRNAMSFITE